jgi:hypothetical protein
MVKRFLPAIRHLVARTLLDQGISQSMVASLLGVTQASVSLYSRADPEEAYSAMVSLNVSKEDAERYAALLGEDLRRDPTEAVETLMAIWLTLLGTGVACGIHREMYPSLSRCEVCIKRFGESPGEGFDAITQVARGVKRLEASPVFAQVMPEVSVNLAYAPPGSRSSADIVAIPGRIVRVGSKAQATHLPEFGGSRHLATMLLIVQQSRPDARACMNVRYDRGMARVLRKLHIHALTIGGYPASSSDPTVSSLRAKLALGAAEFEAIVDTGGQGVEPNLYLFGRSPDEVVKRALEVARTYSAG